jgi:predicted glycosyltransferase
MLGLIKTIIIIAGLFYVSRFIFRLGAIYQANRHLSKMMKARKDHTSDSQKEKTDSRSKPGEYIKFEELKEE